MPKHSALGMASQAPISLKGMGRSRIAPTRNTKVLEKEMTADTRPFERAVNQAEAKILKPINRKAKAYCQNPWRTIW